MTTFVEIAVNVPQVTGVFHYHLPQGLEGSLNVGHLVVVPFGKQTVLILFFSKNFKNSVFFVFSVVK